MVNLEAMIDPASVEFIPLTKGYTAMVDADLYPELARYNWAVTVTPSRAYAQRSNMRNRKGGSILLHHQVLPPKPGYTVDHRYSDTPFLVLDERRSNLRYATTKQQGANRRKQSSPCYSRFKGVSWHKHKLKWCAAMAPDGRCVWLGYFTTEEAAARAYDEAALKHFGEFAKLNFPNQKG